tara:strand:- start:135 stop:1292 length:1158 start_codon:yes stop_codon:yes gene_type:complete
MQRAKREIKAPKFADDGFQIVVKKKQKSKSAARAAHSHGGIAPKGLTGLAALRKTQSKYTLEQLQYCGRLLPEAMLEQGWLVLPEDAGGHASSSTHNHYMYAFAGEGINQKKGDAVPFFSSRTDALAWWEARLLDGACTQTGASSGESSIDGAVRNDQGVIVEANGWKLWLAPTQTSTRRPRLYESVTEKTTGGRGSIFVANENGEHLGAFPTAVHAAIAVAKAKARGERPPPPKGVRLGAAKSESTPRLSFEGEPRSNSGEPRSSNGALARDGDDSIGAAEHEQNEVQDKEMISRDEDNREEPLALQEGLGGVVADAVRVHDATVAKELLAVDVADDEDDDAVAVEALSDSEDETCDAIQAMPQQGSEQLLCVQTQLDPADTIR